MGGFLDNSYLALWKKVTGLPEGEGQVASMHFHATAFWSSLWPLLALLIGNKWIALGAFPWGVTVIIAEAGPKGRWIDVITRTAGCLVGVGFAIWALLK